MRWRPDRASGIYRVSCFGFSNITITFASAGWAPPLRAAGCRVIYCQFGAGRIPAGRWRLSVSGADRFCSWVICVARRFRSHIDPRGAGLGPSVRDRPRKIGVLRSARAMPLFVPAACITVVAAFGAGAGGAFRFVSRRRSTILAAHPQRFGSHRRFSLILLLPASVSGTGYRSLAPAPFTIRPSGSTHLALRAFTSICFIRFYHRHSIRPPLIPLRRYKLLFCGCRCILYIPQIIPRRLRFCISIQAHSPSAAPALHADVMRWQPGVHPPGLSSSASFLMLLLFLLPGRRAWAPGHSAAATGHPGLASVPAFIRAPGIGYGMPAGVLRIIRSILKSHFAVFRALVHSSGSGQYYLHYYQVIRYAAIAHNGKYCFGVTAAHRRYRVHHIRYRRAQFIIAGNADQ